ncbi:MAG: biopolymer transporter ExbD [Polyangiaceae bacterium]|nr:biopolymer transporter ExbD [Polyangiaceae bacterium]
MAGVDVGSGKGGRGRALDRDLNMIPFIDLLFVTIAFLLITAVWSTHARLTANASVPGSQPSPCDGDCGELPDKRLHVYVEPEGFTLSWQQGATVVTETHLGSDLDALEARIVEEWRAHGSHVDPSDPRRDGCVLHADNTLAFGDLAAVIDTVYGAKRLRAEGGDAPKSVPAFDLVFASR